MAFKRIYKGAFGSNETLINIQELDTPYVSNTTCRSIEDAINASPYFDNTLTLIDADNSYNNFIATYPLYTGNVLENNVSYYINATDYFTITQGSSATGVVFYKNGVSKGGFSATKLYSFPSLVKGDGGTTYAGNYGFSWRIELRTSDFRIRTFPETDYSSNITASDYTDFWSGASDVSTDPYNGAGDSDTGGGDGTFDGSSDPVPIPSLPTVGATDAGFITLFAPTSAQLHALASYCWSNLFDVDTFKKLFNDPMDCILGLSVVPVSVPTSGAREITVGNIVTTVQMNVASQQYIEVDCGSISFANKYFGSYLDYEPYTKMAIFLPYCGTHQISADDVMGKTITVKYHIDILTGSCIAFVKCGDSVLYEFNGACASNIPVNSLNYSSTIENAIRIAVNIGTTVATAGASAPLSTATEGASALSTAQNIGRGISLAGSTAEGALSMKPSVSRSGAMGGGVGLLGNQIPYIIITRPRLCKPKNQDHFEGYPSFIYSKIEDLIGQGFTSFTDVIISEQFLTDEEENELEAILKGGVYL